MKLGISYVNNYISTEMFFITMLALVSIYIVTLTIIGYRMSDVGVILTILIVVIGNAIKNMGFQKFYDI